MSISFKEILIKAYSKCFVNSFPSRNMCFVLFTFAECFILSTVKSISYTFNIQFIFLCLNGPLVYGMFGWFMSKLIAVSKVCSILISKQAALSYIPVTYLIIVLISTWTSDQPFSTHVLTLFISPFQITHISIHTNIHLTRYQASCHI